MFGFFYISEECGEVYDISCIGVAKLDTMLN